MPCQGIAAAHPDDHEIRTRALRILENQPYRTANLELNRPWGVAIESLPFLGPHGPNQIGRRAPIVLLTARRALLLRYIRHRYIRREDRENIDARPGTPRERLCRGQRIACRCRVIGADEDSRGPHRFGRREKADHRG